MVLERALSHLSAHSDEEPPQQQQQQQQQQQAEVTSDAQKLRALKRRRSRKTTVRSDVTTREAEEEKTSRKDALLVEETMLEGSVGRVTSHRDSRETASRLLVFQIKFGVLRWYVQAASYVYCGIALVALVFFVAGQASTNIWLSVWSNDAAEGRADDDDLLRLRLGVYGGLGMTQGLTLACIVYLCLDI